jgi:adenine-specific DNA-methyltransferase
VRITGPFTVEAAPFPTALSLEAQSAPAPAAQKVDLSVARSGITSRQHTWRDELLKAGIRGKKRYRASNAPLRSIPKDFPMRLPSRQPM